MTKSYWFIFSMFRLSVRIASSSTRYISKLGFPAQEERTGLSLNWES